MTDSQEMLERKAAAFDKLRKLCGYVENGTDCTVQIFQDDATKDWIVKSGQPTRGNWWHGRGLLAAVEAAEVKED